ncbi:TIGR02466 family protein [Steroidobacter cummioxidans]|uniref:TIGR02466 family protein n=1 Tax=Steroidobacter cummioxidans TaxID=1803913 RepID=UPI000E31E310|nr:TIGR02466 family protein [Steroidobacter cummioxidans]
MPIQTLFPTYIYSAPLQRADWRKFNKQLLRECLQLQVDDEAGQKWSQKNYPGGYTSYHSAHRMQQISPTFAQLEKYLRRHVRSFVKTLELDMTGRELAMTDCWVNIMPQQVAHSMHLHPLSTLSGTYYVQTPKGCAGLKFEDPRLEKFMAAPPRRADASPANRAWSVVPAEAGKVVLFESWLRHEVSANPVAAERISISFNYNWF